MKTCTKCGIEKPVSGFNTYGPPRGGTYAHCKECRASNEKRYRAANADAVAAKRKVHRAANPEVYEARHRAYYDENSEAIKERQRANYAANPEGKRSSNREYMKTRRVNNPALVASQRLKLHYGITLDDYYEMLESQGGLCANPGCFNEPPLDRRFDVDHDHACCSGQKSCGRCVRGLLCRQCNHALGLLRDDPKRVQGLIDYLERHQ